jgi:RNA polymerase sigma-70 factor (ECF subfamily)
LTCDPVPIIASRFEISFASIAASGRKSALRKECAAHNRVKQLATYNELSAFLAEVERRAYKQTLFAVREEQVALDIVQDSMLKLAEKYSGKPAEEYPMLFQRILQNTIRDYFRRQKVRSTWTTLLSALSINSDGEEHDPLETLHVDDESNIPSTPAEQLEQAQIVAIIEEAIQSLPTRQREAFLLRYWEELDVSETAAAMGCSEGSVKTHCSRAVHALAGKLRARGVTL